MADYYFKHRIIIKDGFRDLFKRQMYEDYVYEIISNSETIFRGRKFTKVQRQNNKEPDFIDESGNKYDAKLLLDKKLGSLLGDRNNEIEMWINEMYDISTKFDPVKYRNNRGGLHVNPIYALLKDDINSLEEDENGIIFIPFPMVPGLNHPLLSMVSDVLQLVYEQIRDEGLVKNRNIYFIYPSSNKNEYVLRDDKLHREFIAVTRLEDFVAFESEIIYK